MTQFMQQIGSFILLFGLALSAPTAARGDEVKPSLKAWDEIYSVLTSPRCLNCHQTTIPLQGDERRTHIPLVTRGADNHGVGAMRCGNCHNGIGNNETSGTPGAGGPDRWQLAPLSMNWEGLNSAALCAMLKDKTRNGGRDGEALVKHMDEEPLVLWAWNPGGDRTPPPVSHDQFVALMKVWASDSEACPAP